MGLTGGLAYQFVRVILKLKRRVVKYDLCDAIQFRHAGAVETPKMEKGLTMLVLIHVLTLSMCPATGLQLHRALLVDRTDTRLSCREKGRQMDLLCERRRAVPALKHSKAQVLREAHRAWVVRLVREGQMQKCAGWMSASECPESLHTQRSRDGKKRKELLGDV